MSLNQDWVLARFREDAAKGDPKPYTVTDQFGGAIWLSVNGNVGWYRWVVKDGALTQLRSITMPVPNANESPEDIAVFNYEFKLVGPKQRAKILTAIANHKLTSVAQPGMNTGSELGRCSSVPRTSGDAGSTPAAGSNLNPN